jgi:adenylate cyclase
VLNTTARIQSKCREFETDIIVSDHLLSQFNIAETFYSSPLGLIKLRGKEKEMLLHAIRREAHG